MCIRDRPDTEQGTLFMGDEMTTPLLEEDSVEIEGQPGAPIEANTAHIGRFGQFLEELITLRSAFDSQLIKNDFRN